MNLHLFSNQLSQLIKFTSKHFSIKEGFIEKDYWICKILKELSQSEFADKVYFKGGTSLSKAFGLIKRFSEDLDLFVYTGNLSSSREQEKKLNKNISHFIIEKNEQMYCPDTSKMGGDFRKMDFRYERITNNEIGLKTNLEIETKCSLLEDKTKMFLPFDKKVISPIITEFLEKISRADLVKKFGLQKFKINAIRPERTLCDKISRLVRLSYNDNFEQNIVEHIRDVYDIYCIINEQTQYAHFINNNEFFYGLQKVLNEDSIYNNSQAHQSIANAVVFKDIIQILNSTSVKNAYYNNLKHLVYQPNKMPEFEDIIKSFGTLHNRLQQFDTFRLSISNPALKRKGMKL
jgi:hypothetical protein